MKEKGTINEQCKKMITINIKGDTIPPTWYKYLKISSRSKTDENVDRVDPYAPAILGELVYWYRPTQLRNEQTGDAIGYKQKFWEDKLQKSYQDLSDHFGFKKRIVKETIDRLQDIGLITKEFRSIQTKKGRIHNVLYIEINADAINYISNTIPENDLSYIEIKEIIKNIKKDTCNKGYAGGEGGVRRCVGAGTQVRKTYTESISENTAMLSKDNCVRSDVSHPSRNNDISDTHEDNNKPISYDHKDNPLVQSKSEQLRAQSKAHTESLKNRPKPKPKSRKKLKLCSIPMLLQPYYDVLCASKFPTHKDAQSRVYHNMVSSFKEMENGTLFNEYKEYSDLHNKIITPESFQKFLDTFTLIVFSAGYSSLPIRIKESYKKYTLAKMIYNFNSTSSNKSVFAQYIDCKPQKIIPKDPIENLSEAQRRSVSLLTKRFTDLFDYVSTNNGDKLKFVLCSTKTIPTFFERNRDKFSDYNHTCRSRSQQINLWLKMLNDRFSNADFPITPGILNSEKIIARAMPYFKEQRYTNSDYH